MAILATAMAFAQSTSRVTLTGVDYGIENGPKKACPAFVNFTGHFQVRLAQTSKALSIKYQWVRSDGKTVGPSTMVAGGGDKTVNYTWSLAKSFNGSIQLVILEPSKQSAKAAFRLDCGKTN